MKNFKKITALSLSLLLTLSFSNLTKAKEFKGPGPSVLEQEKLLKESYSLDENGKFTLLKDVPDFDKLGSYPWSGELDKIKEVTFSENVTRVPCGAFSSYKNGKEYGAKNLKKVTFSKNIKEVGMMAFYGAKNLTEIHFNENLKHIKDTAFSGTGISTLNLPKNVTIWEHAFYNCENLKGTLVIPGGVKLFGIFNFGKTNIEHVVIEEGVKNISHAAFCECKNLKTIKCPKSLMFIDGLKDLANEEYVHYISDGGEKIIGYRGSIAEKYVMLFNKYRNEKYTFEAIDKDTDPKTIDYYKPFENELPKLVVKDKIFKVGEYTDLKKIISEMIVSATDKEEGDLRDFVSYQFEEQIYLSNPNEYEILFRVFDSGNSVVEKRAKIIILDENGNRVKINKPKCELDIETPKKDKDTSTENSKNKKEDSKKENKILPKNNKKTTTIPNVTDRTKKVIKILKGENQKFDKDKKEALSFTISSDIKDFKNVSLDGKVVDKKMYRLKKGSTIITFVDDFVNNLTEGEHKFSFSFITGSIDTKINVVDSNVIDKNDKKEENKDKKKNSIKNSKIIKKQNLPKTNILNASVLPVLISAFGVLFFNKKENR